MTRIKLSYPVPGIHLSRDTLVVSVGCVLRTNARGILLGSTKVRRTHPTDLSRLKLVAPVPKGIPPLGWVERGETHPDMPP